MTAWTYCNAAESMRVQAEAEGRKHSHLRSQLQPFRKSFIGSSRSENGVIDATAHSDVNCESSSDRAPQPRTRCSQRNRIRDAVATTPAARQVSIRTGASSIIYIADENEGDNQRQRLHYGRHNVPKERLGLVNAGQSSNNSKYGENFVDESITVMRSKLYLSPKYEAQEISTSFSNSPHTADDLQDIGGATSADLKTSRGSEKESAIVACPGDNFFEEICDDFDDSSSDENDNAASKSRLLQSIASPITERNFLPNVNVQSQNIYEFVKKARKKVTKSWSTFNQQMRKSSVNSVVAPTIAGSINGNKVPSSARTHSSANEKMRSKSYSSVSASTSSIGTGIAPSGGSLRWTSFKTKLRPKYGTVSEANSSSIFYVNPEDLLFDRDINKRNPAETREKLNRQRRKTTYSDLHLARPRPSSPPPPPPVTASVPAAEKLDKSNTDNGDGDSRNHNVKNQNTSSNIQNDINAGVGANYVVCSPPSSSNSDFNLRLRFADEPLYQFYAESVAQVSRLTTDDASIVGQYSNDSLFDGYEEIGSLTSRPSAMELITPSPNGHGQYRSLWCEVEEVKNSGMLEKLSVGRQKLQEAKFEVITSEASYYKSLTVLDRVFVNDSRLRDEKLLSKNDWKILFGNVVAVRKCSQLVLSDLENCWQDDIMLTGLGDIILKHASTNFKLFVKYCSNQIYIDRTLKKLREENANFVEIIAKLEADPVCHSLSLHSFLMLPMQRITRMPLLVDAILSKLELIDNHGDIQDRSELVTFKTTLARLNKIVKECNENARKFERYEEMLLLSRQLEFSRKEVKMFSVASSSRWLVRSGPLLHLNPPDVKLTITRKLTKSTTKLYFFLFNDILVIAKKKSEDNYSVLDYCLRNVMQMNAIEDAYPLPVSSSSSLPSLVNLYSPHRYLLVLTILENHEGKTVEMVLSCDSDSTRQRWLEASYSRLTSDNPDEKLYEEWDCPQVLAVHNYAANQPDELSLQNGDVVKVLKKTTDGWYHGERIRDGMVGWFPGNYTVEIASQHTRAKNLKLRHRLLALSADYLQNHVIQKQ